MKILITILFFLSNMSISEFRKNCDYIGWGEYIKDKEGYEWVYYIYLLQKGEVEKAFKQEEKLKEKKIKKEREIEVVREFYLNKNFQKVFKIAKEHLAKKGKKFGIEESLAFLYSSIILKEKEIVSLLLEKNIIKRGFPYLLAYYFINGALDEIDYSIFIYPDRIAYINYFQKKIDKDELIDEIKNCYRDLPNWLEINIALINSLP